MFEKQWLVRSETEQDLMTCLIRGRGISASEEPLFLNGTYKDLGDPFLPVGMQDAVERILTAAEQEEPITVFGDYDADGITATTVLYHFLLFRLNARVDYYIPDRFAEGYGMSVSAVEKLYERGTRLILTVDNGVSAHEPALRARELCMDLIITDHHQCPEEEPVCLTLLDPHAEGSGFPYCELAGVGVAFTLIRALALALGMEDTEITPYLPVVALGTVGDCVELSGENRILVREGLARLAQGEWLGLNALLEKCKVGRENGKTFSAVDLAYKIVPKLNAAGRLGNAARAVELLLAETAETASDAADLLIAENLKRQETEIEIFREAVNEESLFTTDQDACVIAVGRDWHHGVIGIVASRLVERYGKPAIVLTSDGVNAQGEPIYKGSARSVPGFSLFDALSSCSEYLEKFGGHEMAAGLTVTEKNTAALRDGLNRYAEVLFASKYIPPHFEADCILPADRITVEQIRMLSALEPYGEGNPQPVFLITGLRLVRTGRVGGETGKHLKLLFTTREGAFLEGISFQNGRLEDTVRHFRECSALCNLEINFWNGQEKPSLHILDLHDFDVSLEKRAQCLYNNQYITFESFTLRRGLLIAIYKAIAGFGEHFTFNDLIGIRAGLCDAGVCCSWYLLRAAISVFTELGLLVRDSGTSFTLRTGTEKFSLTDSVLYRAIASEN